MKKCFQAKGVCTITAHTPLSATLVWQLSHYLFRETCFMNSYPKSPFFEKDCKRQPTRRFLGMRIVRRMASSVSSRRDSAPMPASRTSRRPRSRLLRNRRTSLRRKTRRPEGGVACSWARRLSMYCSVWATFRCWRMMWWRALRRSSSSSRRRRARA